MCPGAVLSNVCRELYLWALTIITSRAFSSKVLASVIADSELPDDGVSVLLPLIDLPNHRPLAKVEWRAGEQDVGYMVMEDLAPGEEVANNYGPRNNEQRMWCTIIITFLSPFFFFFFFCLLTWL